LTATLIATAQLGRDWIRETGRAVVITARLKMADCSAHSRINPRAKGSGCEIAWSAEAIEAAHEESERRNPRRGKQNRDEVRQRKKKSADAP
jgi:hypothetical protein